MQISDRRSELERKLSESIEIRDKLEDIVRLSERLAEYLQEIKRAKLIRNRQSRQGGSQRSCARAGREHSRSWRIKETYFRRL